MYYINGQIFLPVFLIAVLFLTSHVEATQCYECSTYLSAWCRDEFDYATPIQPINCTNQVIPEKLSMLMVLQNLFSVFGSSEHDENDSGLNDMRKKRVAELIDRYKRDIATMEGRRRDALDGDANAAPEGKRREGDERDAKTAPEGRRREGEDEFFRVDTTTVANAPKGDATEGDAPEGDAPVEPAAEGDATEGDAPEEDEEPAEAGGLRYLRETDTSKEPKKHDLGFKCFKIAFKGIRGTNEVFRGCEPIEKMDLCYLALNYNKKSKEKTTYCDVCENGAAGEKADDAPPCNRAAVYRRFDTLVVAFAIIFVGRVVWL